MNNSRGYAATTLYRDINISKFDENERHAKMEDFEEELCNLLASGYSIGGSGMNEMFIYAILTKKLDKCVQSDNEAKQ